MKKKRKRKEKEKLQLVTKEFLKNSGIQKLTKNMNHKKWKVGIQWRNVGTWRPPASMAPCALRNFQKN